jgi:hypothetical protein
VCVCVREREGEKARKASSVLSFSLPSLPPSKLQFSNPVSPGLPTPPHAGGINGLRSRGHLPPPHPPPSRCGENPNVTRCPRTAPPPSLPPRRRLLRVCSRWGREKKRSLLFCVGVGGAAAQCGSIRIAPRLDLPRVWRRLRESPRLLLPPPPPPFRLGKVGSLWHSLCLFCVGVGDLLVLEVGCAAGDCLPAFWLNFRRSSLVGQE